MPTLGPSITVECRTANCDQYGIGKTVHSTVIDIRTQLLDWPNLTCGSCLLKPWITKNRFDCEFPNPATRTTED
jgi:hypothetical protein